jgi:hypothetical protein
VELVGYIGGLSPATDAPESEPAGRALCHRSDRHRQEAVARLASREVAERGVFTNMVEFPAVPLTAARFRCQLMAGHQPDHIHLAAREIAAAIETARRIAGSKNDEDRVGRGNGHARNEELGDQDEERIVRPSQVA